MKSKLVVSREVRDASPAILARLEAGLKIAQPQIQARAKAETPVYRGRDKRAHPGALRDSTHVESAHKGKIPELHLISGGNIPFYVRFVEYGTVRMKANPFMRRTIRKEKKAISAILKSELEKELWEREL